MKIGQPAKGGQVHVVEQIEGHKFNSLCGRANVAVNWPDDGLPEPWKRAYYDEGTEADVTCAYCLMGLGGQ